MIKRYPVRYVRTYEYRDDESGEIESIAFMANGYLFPLFKSYAGTELSKALDEYKRGLLSIVKPDIVQALAKLELAQSSEEKIDIVTSSPELLLEAVRAAQEIATVKESGLSLIELLMIVMRVCALPEADHAEALAAGIELLPQEVYEDMGLAFELLNLAIQYDAHVKKNSASQFGRTPIGL